MRVTDSVTANGDKRPLFVAHLGHNRGPFVPHLSDVTHDLSGSGSSARLAATHGGPRAIRSVTVTTAPDGVLFIYFRGGWMTLCRRRGPSRPEPEVDFFHGEIKMGHLGRSGEITPFSDGALGGYVGAAFHGSIRKYPSLMARGTMTLHVPHLEEVRGLFLIWPPLPATLIPRARLGISLRPKSRPFGGSGSDMSVECLECGWSWQSGYFSNGCPSGWAWPTRRTFVSVRELRKNFRQKHPEFFSREERRAKRP